jgi:SAM-dependent methyltransferase
VIPARRRYSLALLAPLLAPGPAPARPAPPLDVGYVPTPEPVAAAMLALAGTTRRDLVYDLGCGDGRIAVMAATRHGARAVGVDLDPVRIDEARRRARRAGVADRVTFVQGDLFEQDLAPATVVTLYLLPRLNLRLRPTLQALAPGTRIVSHGFDMGDWPPQRERTVMDRPIYLWRVGA